MIIKFAHDHCKFSLLFVLNLLFIHRSLADQDQSTRQNKTHIFGIITSIDLLEFIVKHDKSGETNPGETIKQNGCHEEAKDAQSIVATQSEALH